jgi:hypothetical protein
MPGLVRLVPGIHAFSSPLQVVDGRVKPGHGEVEAPSPFRAPSTPAVTTRASGPAKPFILC